MFTFKAFSQLMITAIVLFFLAMQITAVVEPVKWYYWPFTDYPMYNTPAFEGDVIKPKHTIIGIQPGGMEEATTQRDFGLTFFQYERWFIGNLLKNRDPEKSQPFIDHLQAGRSNPFQKLRVEVQPYIISRDGYSLAPVEVLKVIALDEPQEVKQ